MSFCTRCSSAFSRSLSLSKPADGDLLFVLVCVLRLGLACPEGLLLPRPMLHTAHYSFKIAVADFSVSANWGHANSPTQKATFPNMMHYSVLNPLFWGNPESMRFHLWARLTKMPCDVVIVASHHHSCGSTQPQQGYSRLGMQYIFMCVRCFTAAQLEQQQSKYKGFQLNMSSMW